MMFHFRNFCWSCLFSLGGLICLPLKKIVGFSILKQKTSLSLGIRLLENIQTRLFSCVSSSPQVALYWCGMCDELDTIFRTLRDLRFKVYELFIRCAPSGCPYHRGRNQGH